MVLAHKPIEEKFSTLSQNGTYSTNRDDGYFLFVYRSFDKTPDNRKFSTNTNQHTYPASQSNVKAISPTIGNEFIQSNDSGSHTPPSTPISSRYETFRPGKILFQPYPNKSVSKHKVHVKKRPKTPQESQNENTSPPLTQSQQTPRFLKRDFKCHIENSYKDHEGGPFSYVVQNQRPFIPLHFVLRNFAHHRVVKHRMESLLQNVFEDPVKEFIHLPSGEKTHISAAAFMYVMFHVKL